MDAIVVSSIPPHTARCLQKVAVLITHFRATGFREIEGSKDQAVRKSRHLEFELPSFETLLLAPKYKRGG